ncbi:MAG: two-component system sensor histidine kinase NtrB [Syntrophaceae bacterium]
MTIETKILSSFRAGIVAITLDGRVAYINPIGAKILEGCNLSEGEIIHSRASENSFFRVLSESISMHYLPTRVEVELPGKDGDRQFIGFTLAELKDGEARAGICAFFKDLTHVEMTEENENLKQRLLSLGQMAAGLAHEIRNPISSIGVHCSILKSHLSQNEKLLASVTMMAREIEKVEYIIRECLNFVRPAELGIQNVDVGRLVLGLVERFKSLHPGMEFVVRPSDRESLVAEVDAGLMEQAMTNIIANAVDACDRKGKVDLSFGISRHFSDMMRLERRSGPIVHGHSGKEEEFLRITIHDNGPGIPVEVQDKIFVPFYTTKKTGTGLGLAIAQKIIHSHGGVLDLKSDPGKGTDFIIKIPMSQKSG